MAGNPNKDELEKLQLKLELIAKLRSFDIYPSEDEHKEMEEASRNLYREFIKELKDLAK